MGTILKKALLKSRDLACRTHAGALLVAILALFYLLLDGSSADPDLFARVAAGKLIETLGYIPLHDPFAFTPKKPIWIDHEWLSGVIFYQVMNLGRDFGLLAFELILAALTILIAARSLFLRSPESKYSLFWLLVVVLLTKNLWISTVRSQIFTYLFVSISLLAFIYYEKHRQKKFLLLLPLLMWAWAQAHGGFIVGLGLQGAFVLGLFLQSRKIPWLVLTVFLVSFVAAFISPYGAVQYWHYIVEALTMDRPSVEEWNAVIPFVGEGLVPSFCVIMLLIGIWKNRESTDWVAWTLLAFVTLLGFKHIRLIPLLALVYYVYGIEYLRSGFDIFLNCCRKYKQPLIDTAETMSLLLIPLGLWKLSMFLYHGDNFRLDTSSYPVSATEWLREKGQGGNLLVDFNNGSFALWRLYPKYKISLDGRYEELYPNSTVRSVVSALNVKSEEHLQSLSEINPDYILYDHRFGIKADSKMFPIEWEALYSDDKFTVYGKHLNVTDSSIYHDVDIWESLF